MARDFGDLERSQRLKGIVLDEIISGGPMRFDRFMEHALYHPWYGYYAGWGRMSHAGDYLTAPEAHPAFGAFIARFARAAAAALGDADIVVVEQGAGTGALARGFLAFWRASWPGAPPRYVIVEPRPSARDRLAGAVPGVETVAGLDDVAPFTGVFLSNELPDAFPVRRFRAEEGGLREAFVDVRGAELVERWLPADADALTASGIGLRPGCEIETCPSLGPWIANVAARLERGFVLTMDYGYDAEAAGAYPCGTLAAHYRHTPHHDYLRRVGRQDLTAHVNWTALERFGSKAGLVALERTSQREFLTRWGWKEFGRWRLACGATDAELRRLDSLGDAGNGFGAFGALVQARGIAQEPRVEDAGVSNWANVSRGLDSPGGDGP